MEGKQKGSLGMERPPHTARELTKDECERFLREQPYGRLGLCARGEPYVVPVSFVYEPGAVHFHSAKSGRKIDFINENNRVCFQVDKWQNGWASVICYGTVTLRDDLETIKKVFGLFMGMDWPEERLKRASVYIGTIDIEEMTGRCGDGFEPS